MSEDRPPPAGLLHAVVDGLLGIQTWQRTGIVLVLGAATLLGTLIYRDPERVYYLVAVLARPTDSTTEYLMTPFKVDVQRQMNDLLDTFAGSHMIGVTGRQIDLKTNLQTLMGVATLPEFQPAIQQLIKDRWQWPVAAFGDDPKVNHVLALLYLGRFVCGAPPEGWWVLERFPIKEICLVAIPPEGLGLAGLIGGAWRQPIEDRDRPRIEAAFRAAATTLLWRRHLGPH